MRFVRYLYKEEICYGLVEDGEIIQLQGDFFDSLQRSEIHLKLEEVELYSPVEARKIICVGLNYCDHIKEMNLEYPSEPVIFMKPTTALIGDQALIRKVSTLTKRVEFEGELAIVIKKTAKNVTIEEAHEYIFGYTIANDVTARDLQNPHGQWTIAKSFDTFAPIGPWIETEVNVDSLQITTHLNGELRQSSNTKEMLFKPDYLISYLSRIMTLEAKDVILCGTPSNVGEIKNHDRVSVTIENIGVLSNTLVEV